VDISAAEVSVVHLDLDWKFFAESLVVGGKIVEPMEGDRIETVDRPRREVYEVMRSGDSNCWEPSEPQSDYILIHTKRVSAG
jgi:hypothetical protein